VDKDLKLPKSFELKCNTKKSIFDYPPIQKDSDKKDKEKKKVQLSTTIRVQAREMKKANSTMRVEGDNSQVPATEDKKDDNKMAEEKIDEEKVPEEDPTHILKNPCRVLRTQQKFLEYLDDNRYNPILRDRKRGYVFLEDSKPDEFEEYVDDEPLEAW